MERSTTDNDADTFKAIDCNVCDDDHDQISFCICCRQYVCVKCWDAHTCELRPDQ